MAYLVTFTCIIVILVTLVLALRCHSCIEGTEIGHGGRQQRPRHQTAPVEGTEPLVLRDVRNTTFHIAQTLRRVLHEELRYDILQCLRKRRGIIDFARDDLLIDLHRLVVIERRPTVDHLEDEHTQGPVVHSVIVSLVQDDFGREVVRGTAHRPAIRGDEGS